MLIAIIANISEQHQTVPPHEQWISIGASLQNVMLSMESFGYKGKIVSGRRVQSTPLRKAFQLDTTEHLAGFVVMGTHKANSRKYLRKHGSDLLTVWQG